MEGKVALVTGGGSGIGRATAQAFAKKGVKVAVADIDADGGQETVKMIKDTGGQAAFFHVDVSKEDEVKGLIDKVVDTFGGLNFGFNNAGIEGAQTPLHETDSSNWDKIIAINLSGVFYCLKYEITHMLNNGGGAIVNTSSVGGLVGVGNLSAYVASKHGVSGLTRCAALEYSAQGIRVNSVHPGAIRTPLFDRALEENPELDVVFNSMHPIGRAGEPHEIANAVVWLCSGEASFVTGHTMAIDGGWMAQ